MSLHELRGACCLFVATLATCLGLVSSTSHAIIIDGTVADKNTFLAYLINQGGGGNANSFAYLNNGGANGPSTLIADPARAANNFGSRMAAAAAVDLNNNPVIPLTVHVGRNVPRVIFGAFQYSPAGGANTAGAQTLDLADLLVLPARSANNLWGGTDVMLHEIYEGIAGLGGGGYEPSHFTSGYQEENSNRLADGNRGERVIDPTRRDRIQLDNASGDFSAFTDWRIKLNNGEFKRGWLQINGRILGGGNNRVTDIQFAYMNLGGSTSTQYDIEYLSSQFVPEPSTYALLGIGLATLAVCRARQRRWNSGSPGNNR